jgi:peptide/nickel transport system permease protein
MDTSTPVSASPSLTALRPVPERGHWSLAAERFRQHRFAVIGLGTFALLVLLAAIVPFVSPYDPEKTNLLLIYEPPSFAHPFGTDSLGRDVATRILYGGRVSLLVGILAATMAITLGTFVGAIAGFYRGASDAILMRFVDMMYAFPRLFVLIIFGILFGGSVRSIIIALGLLSWMTTSRLVRATFLSLRQREFVEAARCIGASDRRIILGHMLPNALAPIIVAATLGVATAILAESTLSFLGLGIQPPVPTWGNMLKDAPTDMGPAPWLAIFPGLAIFLAVFSINFVGDGLRDAFDPRHTIRVRQGK